MGSGYAEFNDATSKIRGMMVAGKGTFSGTFSADNVNAISHINVRDGAVSAHLGFNFPSGSRTAAFAVPADKETSIADITIPLDVWGEGSYPGAAATVKLSKNGVLIATALISLPLPQYADTIAGNPFAGFSQGIRFIDPDVVGTSYYQIELADALFTWTQVSVGFTSYYNSFSKTWVTQSVTRYTGVPGGFFVKLAGPITVGFRKR